MLVEKPGANPEANPVESAVTFEDWGHPQGSPSPHPIQPCPCCSPVPAILANLATTSHLTSVDWWRERNRCNAQVRNAVFINARIRTVDADSSVANSMAIRHGRIVSVGDESVVRAAADENAEIIDAVGRTILPGFIEPHMHFLVIASLRRFENIGPFRYPTVEGAMARLRELVAVTEPGGWIIARQFDPSLQEGPGTLTRDMLDEVSTEHAILVYNASLHFAYCNSRALEIAGITTETPDLAGSPYGRDEAGNPNGVLGGGAAMASVARHSGLQANYDIGAAALDVCEGANRVGVTTFCDQATGMTQGVRELEIYRALSESGSMTARLRYALSYALQDRWDETDARYGDGNDFARLVGWKIVSDGSNQGFSGLQREPYLHRTDRGVAYVEADALKEMVADRAARGWPLVIHANGDQAIDNTLDAYEAAFDKGLLTNTPCRIEHCSILHDEQIERIARMGLSPSFLIGHVHYWGHAMRDTVFGEAKASLLDRTASCEAKGIRWTLHSDEPVTEMNPLRCIENAVTRNLWKEAGNTLASEEAIPVEAAIRAMTRDAAWQCHSGHEIGSLEVGKLADFVVLDEDPVEVAPDTIGSIRILETWTGGRRVYSAD